MNTDPDPTEGPNSDDQAAESALHDATCSSSSIPRLTCEFVEVTSLVPEGWATWFWCLISESAPFTWGDLNRALVTASDFRRHCEDCLLDTADEQGIPQEDIDAFLRVLNDLGETYVDLEN